MALRRPVVLIWIALAFAFSWGLAGLFALLGGQWGSPMATVMAVGFMFGPSVSTLVVRLGSRFERPFWRSLRREEAIWLKPDRFFAVAWLLPVLLAVATLGASLMVPGVEFSPGLEGMIARYADQFTPEQLAEMQAQTDALPLHPFLLGILMALVAGPTVNAIAAFGEELGWRGFLQRELAPLGFWRASLLVGMVWGLWHAPLIAQGHNYPQHPWIGVGMMVLFCMLWAPILGWIRLRSGSVVAAAIAHGAVNAAAGLPILVIAGGGDLTVGLTGAAGMAVALAVNLVLLVMGVGRVPGRVRG
jgi:membrane protease YdiL (CAAX protease family)